MIHQASRGTTPDFAMPPLPSSGSGTPVSLLRAVKNHRQQQGMSHVRKGGRAMSKSPQPVRRPCLSNSEGPADLPLSTHIPAAPEAHKLHFYPCPACTFLQGSGKRRRFGVRLLFGSQVQHSPRLCISHSNLLSLHLSICQRRQ